MLSRLALFVLVYFFVFEISLKKLILFDGIAVRHIIDGMLTNYTSIVNYVISP